MSKDNTGMLRGSHRFVKNLECMNDGDLAILRAHAYCPLDEKLEGFDLFTGLWWGLREKNQWAPPRKVAWLICKLYAMHPMSQSNHVTLPSLLRTYMNDHFHEQKARMRFGQRFDLILNTPLDEIEAQLNWAFRIVRKIRQQQESITKTDRAEKFRDFHVFDWVRLTNDLARWNLQNTRIKWANEFLNIKQGE